MKTKGEARLEVNAAMTSVKSYCISGNYCHQMNQYLEDFEGNYLHGWSGFTKKYDLPESLNV